MLNKYQKFLINWLRNFKAFLYSDTSESYFMQSPMCKFFHKMSLYNQKYW